MKKTIIVILIVLVFSTHLVQESFAKISIKKVDEKRCSNIYEKFLKMGEDRFLERYPSYPIMGKCMILFKDPYFISKYSQEITQAQDNQSSLPYETKIISSIMIGSNKVLTNFSICYEEGKRTNYVLIDSNLEKIFGKMQRLPDVQCPSFWIVVKSTDIQNTHFSWDYDHTPNPKVERKMF